VTAPDPRALAARELAVQYGISEEDAARRIDLATRASRERRRAPWRCRIGRHRWTPASPLAEFEAGVVASVHGPITVPEFTVVFRTCACCPTARFDVVPGGAS
jgi:hypothetical protein